MMFLQNEGTAEQTWHVGDPAPIFEKYSRSLTIQADGHEMEWLIQQFQQFDKDRASVLTNHQQVAMSLLQLRTKLSSAPDSNRNLLDLLNILIVWQKGNK